MANDAVVHLIDDDDALRDSLAFLLNTARIEVRSYESAQVFLDALPRAEPGCIITDVRMPGIPVYSAVPARPYPTAGERE